MTHLEVWIGLFTPASGGVSYRIIPEIPKRGTRAVRTRGSCEVEDGGGGERGRDEGGSGCKRVAARAVAARAAAAAAAVRVAVAIAAVRWRAPGGKSGCGKDARRRQGRLQRGRLR